MTRALIVVDVQTCLSSCSQAENNRNLPYKGYGTFRDKWRAWEKFTGKYMGIYNTEEEARQAVEQSVNRS